MSNSITIRQRSDGYFNANDMSPDAAKLIRKSNFIEFVELSEKALKIPKKDLINIEYHSGNIYIHPNLAIYLSIFISKKMTKQINIWVEEDNKSRK